MKFELDSLDQSKHHEIEFKGDHWERKVGDDNFGYYTIVYDLNGNIIDKYEPDEKCEAEI